MEEVTGMEIAEARAKDPGERVWWDRAQFLSPDAEDQLCPEVIDVTGIPRYLFFGPYVAMAEGLWLAEASIELCPDAARCRLALQFGVEPDYTTVDVPFGAPGTHMVKIGHKFLAPGLGQIRLWLKKAAFHGEVRFRGAHIARVGDLPSATHHEPNLS